MSSTNHEDDDAIVTLIRIQSIPKMIVVGDVGVMEIGKLRLIMTVTLLLSLYPIILAAKIRHLEQVTGENIEFLGNSSELYPPQIS